MRQFDHAKRDREYPRDTRSVHPIARNCNRLEIHPRSAYLLGSDRVQSDRIPWMLEGPSVGVHSRGMSRSVQHFALALCELLDASPLLAANRVAGCSNYFRERPIQRVMRLDERTRGRPTFLVFQSIVPRVAQYLPCQSEPIDSAIRFSTKTNATPTRSLAAASMAVVPSRHSWLRIVSLSSSRRLGRQQKDQTARQGLDVSSPIELQPTREKSRPEDKRKCCHEDLLQRWRQAQRFVRLPNARSNPRSRMASRAECFWVEKPRVVASELA